MINTNKFKVRELKNGEYKQWILKNIMQKEVVVFPIALDLLKILKL